MPTVTTPSRMLTLLLGLLLAALAGSAGAIPSQVGISGQLLDKTGQPVHYYRYVDAYHPKVETTRSLDAEVRFYNSAYASVPIRTIQTKASAYNGYFNLGFEPFPEMMTKDALWYSLSIDANQNGLDAGDAFNTKVEMSSVPFALSASPVHSFTTHGGYIKNITRADTYYSNLMVAPFETPAGGIDFDTMTIMSGGIDDGAVFSFGLYDETGILVANSGPITVKGFSIENGTYLEVKPGHIHLEPSKVYYTALTTNGVQAAFPNGAKPVAPVCGIIPLATHTGALPARFNPDTLNVTQNIVFLPICLALAPSAQTTAKAAPAPGQGASKPTYRWISPKKGKKQGIVAGKVTVLPTEGL